MKRILLFVLFLFSLHLLHAQSTDKRMLSKSEVQFLTHKIDSIKYNLNRMIIYEKELRQKNYFINEKTGLVDELIATIKYLQNGVDILNISRNDIRKIFGKAAISASMKLVYSIETYKSNCPFMEITFYTKEQWVVKIDYQITDCQKWK